MFDNFRADHGQSCPLALRHSWIEFIMFGLETSLREGYLQTKNNSHQQLLVLATMHKGLDLSVCLQKAGRTHTNEWNWKEYGIELCKNRMGCLSTDKGDVIQIVAV